MENSIPKIKIALITGGSSGIGLAIAYELAEKGYNLLLVSNQGSELEKCKTAIEKAFSVKCYSYEADLANPQSASELYNYCASQNFDVNVLVNNAGMLVFSEVINTSIEKVNTILQLHMVTPTLLCNLFGAKMRESKNGYILNVSSISAVMPYPGISLYGPSKTYMRYFTRAFRAEMSLYNVKATCLLPGATATGLYDPNRVNLKLALRLGVMHQPEFVARKSVKALFSNKAESIPGVMNKIVIHFFPFIPQWIISLVYRKADLIGIGKTSLGSL
jgi:short-subunit dehydrogenase